MVFFGNAPISERKPGTNVPYTSSVSRIRSGRFLSTSPIFLMVAGDSATAYGIAGVDDEERLDLRIEQLVELLIRILELVLLLRVHLRRSGGRSPRGAPSRGTA